MPSNNRIRLSIVSVKATDGQSSIGEGDFEMRVQATEGSHIAVWPDPLGWRKVDVGGPACPIDKDIAIYTIASGSLTKTISVDVTEVDGGFNGGDDTGSGTTTI